MKKILYLVFLLLTLIIPSKVFALDGDISIECDSTTKKVGEFISCILYGHSNEEVSAVETTLKYDSGLTLSNPVVPSIWQGDYENKSLLLYTDTNKNLKFELLRFNVTSNIEGSYNFTFKDTYFTDKYFARVQISNPNYTLKFISAEEAKTEEDKTIAVIVDDSNSQSNNSSINNNANKTTETEENPNSGAFVPVVLIGTLAIIGVVIKFKVKKKIFKL